MKKVILSLILAYSIQAIEGQALPDSIIRKYDAALSGMAKGQVLTNYITSLRGTPQEQLKLLFPLLTYFTNKGDATGIGYTQIFTGVQFVKMGDVNESLKHGISAFKIFDDLQDTFALLKTHTLIGNSYMGSGNLKESLNEWKKGLPEARIFDTHYYSLFLNNIASCFNNMQLPDSAMPYIQEALRIGYINKDSMDISNCLAVMGSTYIAMGQNDLGRTFLHQSISSIKRENNYYYTYRLQVAYDLNEIAQSFLNIGKYDSCLSYARRAINIDSTVFNGAAGYSFELMYKAFEKQNKRDSANEYFRRFTEMQNATLSEEKSKSIQIQHFNESIREQEVAAQKEEQAAKHRGNIENALIALGIVSFSILFLIMSRWFITNEKLIRFLGILALLLVFEFINLLVHPFLEELTNHSQVLVLLLLVGIAGLLIPLHHRLEKWTIDKLIEKNKQVRLAAAKLTIAKLEGSSKVKE